MEEEEEEEEKEKEEEGGSYVAPIDLLPVRPRDRPSAMPVVAMFLKQHPTS